MIKYNEIMSNATVDPEMKSRVMAAVSKAIREQPGGAVVTELKKDIDIEEDDSPKPVRKKKAKRIPMPLIASIAAGVLVLLGLGALGISGYLGKAKSASNMVKTHNEDAVAYDTQIEAAIGAEPEATGDSGDNREIDAVYSNDSSNKSGGGNSLTINTNDNKYKAEQTTSAELPRGVV